MPNKTRRTEINIETHAVTIIRTRGRHISGYCESCRKTVTTFTTEQVSGFLPQTDVRRSIETGDFHLTDESLVCGNSLDNRKNYS